MINSIPENNRDKTLTNIGKAIRRYNKQQRGLLIQCSLKYNNATRVLLGIILDTEKIKKGVDDIMESLISKKVLTKDKVDILLENYGQEIKNRGDSTYFKVQTITVNEDTLSLLNENYN